MASVLEIQGVDLSKFPDDVQTKLRGVKKGGKSYIKEVIPNTPLEIVINWSGDDSLPAATVVNIDKPLGQYVLYFPKGGDASVIYKSGAEIPWKCTTDTCSWKVEPEPKKDIATPPKLPTQQSGTPSWAIALIAFVLFLIFATVFYFATKK